MMSLSKKIDEVIDRIASETESKTFKISMWHLQKQCQT